MNQLTRWDGSALPLQVIIRDRGPFYGTQARLIARLSNSDGFLVRLPNGNAVTALDVDPA